MNTNTKYKINLFKHNADSLERVKSAFLNGEKTVGIIQATGTGKTYQALELMLENPDKKILYLVPNNSIIEHIKSIIRESEFDLEKDFGHVEFLTYQALSSKDDEVVENIDTDFIIFDEFHHIGAPIWGEKVSTLVDTHPDAWKFGMSAYSIRRRGTIYERDMALPGGNEIFSDKIVTNYSLEDAMVDGVLPIPTFTTIYFDIEERLEAIENSLFKVTDSNLKEYINSEIKRLKRLLPNQSRVQDLLKDVLTPEGKYIYFSPPGKTTSLEELEIEPDELVDSNPRLIDLHIHLMEDLLSRAGFSNYHLYKTVSDMENSGKDERTKFYDDNTNTLRMMFNINQYGEGVHAPNVTGVIMSRSTSSDIVAFEQIGRALSVDDKKDKYNGYDILELFNLAKKRNIDIDELISEDLPLEEKKKVIIDRLTSPYIIDLAGNIKFIYELENRLKAKVEERRRLHLPVSVQALSLANGEYSIVDIKNNELNKILNGLKKRLKIDKVAEFIEKLNTGDMTVFIYENNPNYFSNGDKYSEYYSDHKDEIRQRLYTDSKYETGYEVAKKTLYYREEYSLKEKIGEYIELLNSGKTLKEIRNEPLKFKNGSSVHLFWEYHKEDIKKEIETNPKYEQGYERAKETIRVLFFRLTLQVVENKIKEFLEELIKGNKSVLVYRNNNTFSDGSTMGQFLSMYKDRIIEYIKNHPEYESCLEYISEKEYDSDKQNRITEFIEILNAGNAGILSVNNPYTFKNGKPVNKFFADKKNKEEIKDRLYSDPKYSDYDVARRLIEEYEYRYSFKNRYKEFIDMLNNHHPEVLQVINGFTFSDGITVNYFFSKYKDQIIKELEKEEYSTGYEYAKEAIEKYMYDNTLGPRVMDFITLVEENGEEPLLLGKKLTFKNGELTSKFWTRHRYKILSLLDVIPGYENAKRVLNEFEIKHDDTSKKKLANTYKIPYEEIRDIPISEVYVKCEYLKSIKENPYDGKLHEIFNMSSSRMAKKYNVSLEDLLSTYVRIWSR